MKGVKWVIETNRNIWKNSDMPSSIVLNAAKLVWILFRNYMRCAEGILCYKQGSIIGIRLLKMDEKMFLSEVVLVCVVGLWTKFKQIHALLSSFIANDDSLTQWTKQSTECITWECFKHDQDIRIFKSLCSLGTASSFTKTEGKMSWNLSFLGWKVRGKFHVLR